MESSFTNYVLDHATGETRSLKHLRPFTVTYNIRVDGEPVEVGLNVHFTNHCFTRSKKEEDPAESVLYRERHRQGEVERVFCQNRWGFSQGLPDIIKSLPDKLCFRGGSKLLFYRQEGAPPHNSHAGWYLCVRFDASDRHQNLTMSVRSVHKRQNRPHDTRGAPTRFRVLLAQFYSEERKKREWL